ncbi:hypothetical protein QJS66_12290 [Kocuria rhizophila]|nr:hypothetical protein QJS66_12290 [Kocuria rhizophila]
MGALGGVFRITDGLTARFRPRALLRHPLAESGRPSAPRWAWP